jgi:hypothetical protein
MCLSAGNSAVLDQLTALAKAFHETADAVTG